MRLLLLCLSLAAAFSGACHAQAYPSRPIRFIVPFAPGGPSDLLARMVGQRLTESWGQQVLVENKPGANGNIGMELGAKSAPDGYTLVSVPNGNIVVNPNLFHNLPYQQKDFAPVTLIAKVENILVVPADSPAKSVADLVALAKAQPGKLSFGSPGVGSQAHLAGEYLKLAAGIDLTHVPYKGVGPAVNDLIGGQISLMFAQMSAALPQVKGGKLRALALASLQRSPVVADLPTVAESGYPGFEAVSWYALMVPAGTPAEIIGRLHDEVVKMLQQPEMRERLAGVGAAAVGNSPEELAALIRLESARYADVVKRANIKAD